jgi:hypothetical protein
LLPVLIVATSVIAEPVSNAPDAVGAGPDRRRSAVEGSADIDHLQLDGCF